MKINLIILSYCLYLPIGVFVTYWIGKSLYTNGKVFLERIFRENQKLVDPVNKLLLTGYYLLNLGYMFILMVQKVTINSGIQLIEVLSSRVGFLLITLGCIHFFNLLVFFIISKKNQIIQHN